MYPHWGTDKRPAPATHHPTTRGALWELWTSKIHNGRDNGRTSGCSHCTRPVRPSAQPKGHTDHDEARPGDGVHYLCIKQQTVGPREGGVLQLRVARNLCDYVSSGELPPSPWPSPAAPNASLYKFAWVARRESLTVQLFRVASMSLLSNILAGTRAQHFPTASAPYSTLW